jgi:hypothetical protein
MVPVVVLIVLVPNISTTTPTPAKTAQPDVPNATMATLVKLAQLQEHAAPVSSSTLLLATSVLQKAAVHVTPPNVTPASQVGPTTPPTKTVSLLQITTAQMAGRITGLVSSVMRAAMSVPRTEAV